ncbi:MAG TPA: 1-(5-phosphoribosyl)-5-[(5-phosphoribosylamino)methylideneamino]imidazole-4-carboxamide isomerase [Terriglobia bacterium]|nr:1-(5-phosphoribosyl)-5-[(5-phosphoribosylamino)methylideneamino]imidazole-4-carboxamide isomerase [Terriglobia bacterium]
MIIFPAIDMRQGRCVRLLQGRPETATVYFDDPVAAALAWEQQGAPWLHLIDLDGAMGDQSINRAHAKHIFKALKIPVQFGGGVRNMENLEDLLQAGARRVILGTAAVEDPGFVKQALSKFQQHVAIGLDAREGMIAIRGWQQVGSVPVLPLAKQLAEMGASRIVYTDISKDGMLDGPDLTMTRQLAVDSGLKVIASGGISCLEDVRQVKELEPLGVEGIIVGKALYERKFTLNQALQYV